MKKSMLLFSVICILGIQSCSKDEPELSNNLNAKEKSRVSEGNSFAIDLFKLFPETGEDSNFVISPLSVSLALSMAYNGAEGETKSAFESALRFSEFTRAEINDYNKKIIELLLKADEKIDLKIAHSIWSRNNFTVLESFTETNKTYYDADIFSADFTTSETLEAINGWCSDKTSGKIPEIINRIPSETAMILLNALYFNAPWKTTFDSTATKDIVFTKSNGDQVSQQQMKQYSKCNYMYTDFMQMIELPYGNENFSMLFLLPTDDFTITDLINELDYTTLDQWVDEMDTSYVVVRIPKFKFEWGREINNEIKSLGLEIAFGSNADFSGINMSEDIAITQVIHKLFFNVNEAGTEAAAVTDVHIGWGSSPIFFTVDKPFLFILKEKTSDVILFIGKVEEPIYEE